LTNSPFEDHVSDRPLTKAQARAMRRQDRQGRQPGGKPLEAKTANQRTYLDHLFAGRSVFAVGGAGTGKTYLPARIAARRLVEGRVDKIIVCRVTVANPRHALGFLPGKLDQKLEPWLVPVMDGIKAEVSAATLDLWKKDGRFEIVSFEHMRGRTFSNAFVLFDEAQNATLPDLRLFLTRIGEEAQVVVTGDMDQIDIHDSGLNTVIGMALDHDVPMEVVQFTSDDVVRSAMAKAWVKAFEFHNRVDDGPPVDLTNVSFLAERRAS
jgi:phosphate starvation-inducible PhoH-like protein